MTIRIHEITALAELEALRPEWEALWRGARDATPFQSPAWLIPWWRHFGPDGAPLVLALREGDALVGLAPFFTFVDDAGRARLLLLGTGNTDHLDALFLDAHAGEAAAAVLEHLVACDRDWQEIDLQQLRPGSPLLDAAAPAGARDEQHEEAPCPALPLPASADELLQRLPRGFRRQLGYRRRRAEKAGGFRIENGSADTGLLHELLEALFALHGSRWQERGERGVLSDARVQAFHREAAEELRRLGALRCYGLRLDEQVIGVYYGMGDDRRAYYYLGGFDPVHAKLSPGALAVGHAIAEAAQAGAREFDFLRGQEPYKYEWGATDRPSWRRVLRPNAEHVA